MITLALTSALPFSFLSLTLSVSTDSVLDDDPCPCPSRGIFSALSSLTTGEPQWHNTRCNSVAGNAWEHKLAHSLSEDTDDDAAGDDESSCYQAVLDRGWDLRDLLWGPRESISLPKLKSRRGRHSSPRRFEIRFSTRLLYSLFLLLDNYRRYLPTHWFPSLRYALPPGWSPTVRRFGTRFHRHRHSHAERRVDQSTPPLLLRDERCDVLCARPYPLAKSADLSSLIR